MTLFIVLLVIFSFSEAVQQDDEVTSLPGWEGNLNSKMYSGLIPSNEGNPPTHYQHYFFVESENNPEKDPVVVWNQGGPGGPSLFGAFVEQGPFRVSDERMRAFKDIPKLEYNEHGWQKFANVLFITSPAPVGYSYCTDNCGTAENPWDDAMYGEENGIFLNNFFKAYPKFRNNDLYLTGESYAGIYVPSTVQYIVANNEKLKLNLKGFGIGNGCMGTEVGICAPGDGTGNPGMIWWVDYMKDHQQISSTLYKNIISECGRGPLTDGSYQQNQVCMTRIDEMFDTIGGYFIYDLYDECSGKGNEISDANLGWLKNHLPKHLKGALNDYPCGTSTGFTIWTNLTETYDALNIPRNVSWFAIDDGWPGYKFSFKDLRPWYMNDLPKLNLKVLIYSGDVDACINTAWTEDWVSKIGFDELAPWRPWTKDGAQSMGGYVTRYDHNFTFATVRGAGHMVPLVKPEAAKVLIENWINNIPLPPYMKPSQSLKKERIEL